MSGLGGLLGFDLGKIFSDLTGAVRGLANRDKGKTTSPSSRKPRSRGSSRESVSHENPYAANAESPQYVSRLVVGDHRIASQRPLAFEELAAPAGDVLGVAGDRTFFIMNAPTSSDISTIETAPGSIAGIGYRAKVGTTLIEAAQDPTGRFVALAAHQYRAGAIVSRVAGSNDAIVRDASGNIQTVRAFGQSTVLVPNAAPTSAADDHIQIVVPEGTDVTLDGCEQAILGPSLTYTHRDSTVRGGIQNAPTRAMNERVVELAAAIDTGRVLERPPLGKQ